MVMLRVLVGLLAAAAIALALVPLMILLDLKDGGTGWGLCSSGLAYCRNSYFAGFELLATVVLVMLAVVALIALCVRLLRVIERRKRETEAATGPRRSLIS